MNYCAFLWCFFPPGSWDSGDFVGEVVLEDCEVELGTALLITGPHGVGKTTAVYACAQELGFKVCVNVSTQNIYQMSYSVDITLHLYQLEREISAMTTVSA